MADFFFFTDLDAVSEQTEIQSYGPVSGNPLGFRVNNRFTVTQNAPAIAITEGIPMVQQCATDPDCVNIVLFPIKNIDFDFPTIKLFIYRGVRKASLFETNGNLQPPNPDWKTNNILQVLKDLQDKINADLGTSEVAKAENLGYHYSDPTDTENFKADTEFVERIIFLNDGLQLPLVKAGCQLGEFIGEATKEAGLQLVLDRIGYEPTLGLVRAEDDVVTVNELTLTTEVAKFQHRHEKEAILTYVDPAALYGCARANKAKVRAYENPADKTGRRIESVEAVNKFRNKNVCYLDIRNDNNYSFNYYNNFDDTLNLCFQQSNSEELLEVGFNYYESWPLLRLDNRAVPIDNPTAKVILKLPINDAAGFNARYFLRSYSLPFVEKEESNYFQELNNSDPDSKIRTAFNEDIIIKAWIGEEGFLGANYFFFKYSKIHLSEGSNDIVSRRGPYDFIFPTNLKLLFGDDDLTLEDGDFKVFIYSSENNPVCLKNLFVGNSTFYTQYVGIAQDQNNTSFFSFADRVGHDSGKLVKYPFSIIRTGNYDNQAFINEFEYDPLNEELGFLAALPLRISGSNLELKKVNSQFNGQEQKFLYFLNTQPANSNRFQVDAKQLHVITITNDEYNSLIVLRNQEFSPDYKVYLHIENDSGVIQDFDGYSLGTTTLKLIGLNFNSTDDKVETKEIEVITGAEMEKSELNFYVNKT